MLDTFFSQTAPMVLLILATAFLIGEQNTSRGTGLQDQDCRFQASLTSLGHMTQKYHMSAPQKLQALCYACIYTSVSAMHF